VAKMQLLIISTAPGAVKKSSDCCRERSPQRSSLRTTHSLAMGS
jgi:hypothetical protein